MNRSHSSATRMRNGELIGMRMIAHLRSSSMASRAGAGDHGVVVEEVAVANVPSSELGEPLVDRRRSRRPDRARARDRPVRSARVGGLFETVDDEVRVGPLDGTS